MKEIIYEFLKNHKLGIVSSINADGKPESALVGIAVSEQLEIIFDTVKSSRKYRNINANPHVSFAIGWNNETTIQYEGEAMVLGDDESSDLYREMYYRAWPDGKERTANWSGLVHLKVAPKWMRYSNFNEPVKIEEISF